MNERLKIAICGTRGIPACYGGFETFAEELATRLVSKGNCVRVYGRKHLIDFDEKYYNCLLYTSPSPRDRQKSRMPSSA